MWNARRSARLYCCYVKRESYSAARQGMQMLISVALKFSFADASIEQINATTQPSKGSIIFDFGGPGNINVDNFAGSNGQALLLWVQLRTSHGFCDFRLSAQLTMNHRMTGGVYDLVTFEPRCVSRSQLQIAKHLLIYPQRHWNNSPVLLLQLLRRQCSCCCRNAASTRRT
jgi:hypothetical protein